MTTNLQSFDPPSLNLIQTLSCPTGITRAWSAKPHPSPRTPLLAVASSDKSVHIWDMRNYQLLSTISGGHKRSVRCVSWKNYGAPLKSDEQETKKQDVLLATGSFDANAGLWVWNRESLAGPPTGGVSLTADDVETDFTQDGGPDEEEEDWHFTTLLTGPDSEIKDLEFSPPHYSANLLATCSRDKSVWVWEEVEPDEWETVAVLSEHAGDVKTVAWCRGARLVSLSNDEGYRIIGCREILASGSYDDTIRLWRDVEEEGDWTCVGVIEGHGGTVWDVKWEPHINESAYTSDTSPEEISVDWQPRLISCSDDMTVRVWRRELPESEKEMKRHQIDEIRGGHNGAGMTGEVAGAERTTGFASSRLPSVIRPASSLERWQEETKLPQVHLRSVYAIDWSEQTGLVVSCGGDGTIAVYREVPEIDTDEDTVMTNGESTRPTVDPVTKKRMKWEVIAQIDSAHNEYEVNHVCWATRRDKNGRLATTGAEEEVIISTGDDGDAKVWELPLDVLKNVVPQSR